MIDISACIVTYKTKKSDLDKVLESFFKTKLNIHLFISDNSPSDELREYFKNYNDSRITYIYNNKNGGYGFGHNRILDKIKDYSKYHLILNPDIYFNEGVLEELFRYMEENKDIGDILPMVKYPSGEIQYLCKRIPKPKDLILRKFIPFRSIVEKNDYIYEMRDTGYNKIMNVPVLSGCFMFLRTSVFLELGGFDERYFMYLEDYDLSRRIGEKYRNVFYPNVEIVHAHAKESYKSKKMLIEHIKSAIKFFNKWGWL